MTQQLQSERAQQIRALERFLARPNAPRIDAQRLATILQCEATNAQNTLPGFSGTVRVRSIYAHAIARAFADDPTVDAQRIDTLARALDSDIYAGLNEAIALTHTPTDAANTELSTEQLANRDQARCCALNADSITCRRSPYRRGDEPCPCTCPDNRCAMNELATHDQSAGETPTGCTTCPDCVAGKIPASGCSLPAHEYTEVNGTRCWNCGTAR